MSIGKISIKKGDIVRQILDTTIGQAYLRIATMQPNSPASPINMPSGFIDISYVAEHDMELRLQLNGRVMDLDNNPYVKLLDE